MPSSSELSIYLVYSPSPRIVKEVSMQVPRGTTAWQAIMQSGWLAMLSAEQLSQLTIGIWGKRVAKMQHVREGDRLELYRPLRVDPKIARRERFSQQGAKKSGLFKTRRTGAKAGY